MFRKFADKLVSIREKLSAKPQQDGLSDIDNKARLASLIAFVAEVIPETVIFCNQAPWVKGKDDLALTGLIRMLTDSITYPLATALIMSKKGDPQLEYGQLSMLSCKDLTCDIDDELDHQYHLLSRIASDMQWYKPDEPCIVDLSKSPVLVFPWEKCRLRNALINYGTERNPWREDPLNYHAQLYLPMGVCFVDNGKHSGFTGVIKRQGQLVFSPESPHEIVDVSKLYDYIAFDGENYIFTEQDRVIGKAKNFEIGCIFEIGRLMRDLIQCRS